MVRERGIKQNLPGEMEWQIDTPFLDRFKAIGIAKLGIIYAILSVIIFIISPQTYLLIAVALVFVVLILLLVFGSHRRVVFRVDSNGAEFSYPTRIKGANKIIGTLTLILGISNGRPGASTVGLTGALQPPRSSAGWRIEWKDVREISFYPKERVVLLKEKRFTGGLGGGLATLRIYCTPENYESVLAMCMNYK